VLCDVQEGVTLEQLEADSPDMQAALSLRQQYHEALQEMGLLPGSDAEQDAAAAAAAEGEDPAEAADSKAQREALLEQLHVQLEQMIAEKQDVLNAAFKQLDLPETDWSLDGGDDSGGSGSSSKRKQLTGR